MNNQVYKLNGIEQFDKPVYFIRGGIGVIYYVTKSLSAFVQYMGGSTIPIKFGESDSNEELQYIAHTFGFGVSVNILPKK